MSPRPLPVRAGREPGQLHGMDAETSQCVADHLASACDLLAEAIAFGQAEGHPCLDSVMLAFGTLYKLRAEIGFCGGMVNADLAESDASLEAAQ